MLYEVQIGNAVRPGGADQRRLRTRVPKPRGSGNARRPRRRVKDDLGTFQVPSVGRIDDDRSIHVPVEPGLFGLLKKDELFAAGAAPPALAEAHLPAGGGDLGALPRRAGRVLLGGGLGGGDHQRA